MTLTKGARPRRVGWIAVVFVAAVVMGLPTLWGGFVGGDDHRLVLNHVLVNHPSLAHAIELFSIVHRDLYQPLPLLTFSLEFAVADLLNLFRGGVQSGAWLFHLDNVWLHAINAVLVFALIRRLSAGDCTACTGQNQPNTLHTDAGGTLNRSTVCAVVAAILFAVHPFQVEVVAWVNGRMMLLSTLFALASLIAWLDWASSRSKSRGLLVLLFVLLCQISKIRIELPLLMVFVAFVVGRRIDRRSLVCLVAAFAMTAFFVIVNVQATTEAGFFEGAAKQLQGSRIARSVLALAFYFQHFLWPTGLASWYPTPDAVSWTDVAVLKSLAIVLPVFGFAAFLAVRGWKRGAPLVWFVLAIGATLPLVPARNTLAADRYMYLPIIGLVWWLGRGAAALLTGGDIASRVRRPFGVFAAIATVVLIAQSWHTAKFYNTPLLKTLRLTQIYPDTPHVWERLAWSYLDDDRFDDALASADRELANPRGAKCEAYQAAGMAHLGKGHTEQGLGLLRRAIEIAPTESQPKYRLACAFQDLGRLDDALSLFEVSIAQTPLYNPGIIRLANLHRSRGNVARARELFTQAVENNPYEVPAILGLAEFDIEIASPEAFDKAETRLTKLLSWMPENLIAHTHLGVVFGLTNRVEEAVNAYRAVLAEKPTDVTAMLNLAQLLHRTGDDAQAKVLFERLVGYELTSVAEVAAMHDFFVATGQIGRTPDLWRRLLNRDADNSDAVAFYSWSLAITGKVHEPQAELNPDLSGARADSQVEDRFAMRLTTLAYIAHVQQDYASAGHEVRALCARSDAHATAARRRMMAALERYDSIQPDVPWTFCFTAELLLANDQLDAAGAFTNLCKERCADDACRERVVELGARFQAAP